MRKTLLLLATVLAVLCASAAVASVDWNVTTIGDTTTYSYFFTNTEEDSDSFISLHVFAPMNASLIKNWSADDGWGFATDIDLETGDADIYWYSLDPDNTALNFGDSLQVSFNVPKELPTITNHEMPGALGNWGYETYDWAGFGVWVMMPSVPVPGSSAPSYPEPISVITLASGLGMLFFKRIRKYS